MPCACRPTRRTSAARTSAHICLLALLLAAPGLARSDDDAVVLFQRLAAHAADSRCATTPAVTLDIPEAAEARYADGRLHLLFRMAFRQITEGWNWHPEARPDEADYYRHHYLPLASREEARGRYRQEDKIGAEQEVAIVWRHDYFFAFDNLYDFYPRRADDDAGFVTDLPLPPDAAATLIDHGVRLRVSGHLAPACLTESTTFWKAIHARPTDLTLKKHYLLGTLDAVEFRDAADGRLLTRLLPRRTGNAR